MDMKTKDAFHELIDKIEDEEILKGYFELIKRLNNNQSGALWDSLSEEERKDLCFPMKKVLTLKIWSVMKKLKNIMTNG